MIASLSIVLDIKKGDTKSYHPLAFILLSYCFTSTHCPLVLACVSGLYMASQPIAGK